MAKIARLGSGRLLPGGGWLGNRDSCFPKNYNPPFRVARKVATPPPDLPVGIWGKCLAIFSKVVEDTLIIMTAYILKNRWGSGVSPPEKILEISI